MQRIIMAVMTVATLMAGAVFTHSPLWAQQQMDQQQPSNLTSVTGKVQSVDAGQNTITITDNQGNTRSFSLDQSTAIRSANGALMKITDIKNGDSIQVTYIGPSDRPQVTVVQELM